MSNLPLMKTDGGYYYPIAKKRNGYYYPLYGGEDECNCCDAECCQNLLNGTFNGSGQLVYESDIITVTIDMPTPNSRRVCNGDQLTLTMVRKSPYDTGSTFEWHLWLDRDWLHQSHTASTELHEGAHWFIWETTTNETVIVIKWTECWMDYAEQYGDIRLGTNVGDTAQEFVDIFCEEESIPAGTECCIYDSECVECEFLFPSIGDPVGPEQTTEGVTYWFDDDDADEWAMKIISVGPDPVTRTMDRDETIILTTGIRPPKDAYTYWASIRAETCFEYENWKSGTGTQSHPQYPGLADALPATGCYPATFAQDTSDCPQIHRFEFETRALLYVFTATITECYDENCGDELNPGDLVITAEITAGDTATVTGTISNNACSLVEDCCNLEECCPGLSLEIDATDFTIDDPPANGYIASGTVEAPPNTGNYHTWRIYCYPNPVDDFLCIQSADGGDFSQGLQTCGGIPGTVVHSVTAEEGDPPEEYYTITATCPQT